MDTVTWDGRLSNKDGVGEVKEGVVVEEEVSEDLEVVGMVDMVVTVTMDTTVVTEVDGVFHTSTTVGGGLRRLRGGDGGDKIVI